MPQRRGFTFIEVMIAITIVGILSAIVYPMVVDLEDVSQARVMQATVRDVRERIGYHAALRDVPVSQEGFPLGVDPEWFPTGQLPRHAWTGEPMNVQVVHGPKEYTQPNNKTYQEGDDGGHDAWYNATNGSFCALVPAHGSDAEIRGRFDLINGLGGSPSDSSNSSSNTSSNTSSNSSIRLCRSLKRAFPWVSIRSGSRPGSCLGTPGPASR